MNKILLINPNPSEFIKPSSFNMVQPNALLMLGSALKEAHCDPIILDLRLSSDIKSDIQKVFPRNMLFVGITMMTSQISQALKVLKIIKELDSQIPVIVGGVHPTLFPEQVLREPEIDFCVMYEGEETIIELTQELKNNSADFHKIKGIGYKKNGAVMINPKREFIKMDTLPFINWDLLDMSPYMLTKMSFLGSRHSVNIQSSRGCPYTCTFCINVCLKERWRCKSPERVIEEIRKAKEKLNINFVYFRDENFFVKKDRALEIATGMKELGIEWCANARANYFNDRNLSVETLTQLSNCNLKMLGIGAESGSQRILDKLSKGITVEDVIRTAEYLSTTDIIGNFSFLTGIPTETKEEILATVNVIKKIQKINKKIILAGPQIFRPYPGGTLYEECIRYGLQAPQSLKEWATVDLLETRGSLPLSKLPWIKEKDLTLAVNQYVVMASFPISQFGFSPRGLMVLISKIRYAFGFFKFPVEYKLFYTFKKFMTTIKKKPKTHNYACIIANKLDDRLRLVTRVITEKYRDVSHYYFYYTRSPVNRIKGMQDIEDELHDITTKNNEIIFRTGESLIKKLAVIVKIISMDIRYIFISAEFKSNIFSMMIIYLFCLVKGIHIIFIESNNTFNTKGTVKVKDIFSLFTLKNMRKYYCYVHDASFMHMGLSAYVKYPRNIVIEPTTVCNLKCTLCPRGANVLNRSIEQMDVEKYKKFIHEAPLYVDSIYFTLYGEPLLHGNIIEMLRFAKQSGIRHIELSTNANIKRENAFFSELVLSGLDCINIAVDSMNQEVYSDYRKGGDISTVLTFIDTLVLIKKKHNITRPLLRIQILDLKHNEHERKIMQYKLLKRGVDNVFVKPLVDFTLRSENEYTHFKKSTDTNTQQRDNTFVCKALFTTMVISASGDLMLCCLDYKVNHAIGNVFTEGFKAYSNKKFIAYRQLFLKNKLQIPLCNECITFNREIRSIT